MAMNAPVTDAGRSVRRQSGLSYKFQRLREKIRRAVETGELSGKLPGERSLARRFRVNAKTLSKALTDLAAEGVLDRSIGRGTFVKGSIPAQAPPLECWLALSSPGDHDDCLLAHLREVCPGIQVETSVKTMRPSFLNQFTAVLSLSASTPADVLRDLLVRNMAVVAINHEPKAYSTPAVLPDLTLGISRLGRDLVLAGHRRLGALEPRDSTTVARTLRQTAGRYVADATVDSAEPAQAATLVDSGITALVCSSASDARQARAALAARGINVPSEVSLASVGCMCAQSSCSGYLVECRQIADAAIGLLREAHSRPVTLWLAGSWIERGTLAPTAAGLPLEQPAPLRVSGVVV